MLESGVIEPSTSRFSSPPVLVERPGKNPRFCVDYRDLNQITVDECAALPRISDALKNLSSATIFSVLDLKSGYWQVPLHPDSKELTAFSTPDGACYQFCVMPFGLKGAPATFQKLMTAEVLIGYIHRFVQVYLDDIIIYSSNRIEHLQHLRLVFERLHIHHLKVSPEKCVLLTSSLNYLGHHLHGLDNMPQAKHLEAVKNFPVPRSKKQLQSFIGVCNWLAEYVPNLATLMAPLTDLLRGRGGFSWKSHHNEAFERVKRAMSNTVTLSRPNFDRPFILQTDASSLGMGAVLYQEDPDGTRRVISHISAKFNPTTARYHVNEQECLCILWAIRHFRAYLEYKPFTLRTDSRAVTWLHKFKDVKAKLTRWALLLQEFSFEVEHIPGRTNELPDLLSRQPGSEIAPEISEDRLLPPETPEVMESDEILPSIAALYSAPVNVLPESPNGLSVSELERRIGEVQRESEHYREKVALLNSFPTRAPSTVREKSLIRDFIVENDLLFRRDQRGNRLVVPKELIPMVIWTYHDSPEVSHPGVAETHSLIYSRYYWRNLLKTVRAYVRNCVVCSKAKTQQRAPRAPMSAHSPRYPFEMISLDILGPYPVTSRGNRYILIAEDVFSRWVEAEALSEVRARDVCNFLRCQIFSRFGYPHTLISDQGRPFVSDRVRTLCQKHCIEQCFSAAYHQRANPVERRVQEFKKAMRIALINKSKRSWDVHLHDVLRVLRSRTSRATGFTPAKLLLGYELPRAGEWDTLSAERRKCLSQAARHDQVHDARERNMRYQRREYKNSNSPHIVFRNGDRVNIRQRVTAGDPFGLAWRGPFMVLRALGDTTYAVDVNGTEAILHLDDIRPAPTGNLLSPLGEETSTEESDDPEMFDLPSSSAEPSEPTDSSHDEEDDALSHSSDCTDNASARKSKWTREQEQPILTTRSKRRVKPPQRLDL